MSTEEIKEAYYNPKLGLQSARKLAKKLNVPLSKVEEVLNTQETVQIFKKQKQKYNYPLKSDNPFQRVQIDLMDMRNENPNKNQGMKYIFCAIDVFTRYAFAYPIKSKETNETLVAFEKAIEEIHRINGFIPSQVDSDNESAFLSKPFQAYLEKNNIKHNVNQPGDHRAQGVVERFNRTMREMYQRYKNAFNKNNWVEILPDIIQNYNTTHHSSLPDNRTPLQAVEQGIGVNFHKRVNIARVNNKPINLNEGDKVRLMIKKNIFEKGTSKKWTKSIHTITKFDNGKWFVNGRVEGYKPFELMKINADTVEKYSPEDEESFDNEEKHDQRERRIDRRIAKEEIERQEEDEEDKRTKNIGRRAAVGSDRRIRKSPVQFAPFLVH